MDLGNKLQQLRKERNLSQTALAELITAKGYPITNKGISSWELNITVPNAYQFLAVCDVLHVADINKEFLDQDTALNRLMMYAQMFRKLPVYTMAVSAGTGEFVEDDSYEMVTPPISVPTTASYGVYINGDSMEPLYKDNDLVWVQKTLELNIGDIGIFYVDGQCYCKKLGKNMLISENKKYYPIHLSDVNEFKVLGKVVN